MTATTQAADDQAGSFRDDVKVISLIGVAHFFSHFYILLLPPLFPLLKDAFGVHYVDLGLFVMAFSAATGVSPTCGPRSGAVAARSACASPRRLMTTTSGETRS